MVNLVNVNDPKEVGREKLRLGRGREQQGPNVGGVSTNSRPPIPAAAAERLVKYYQTALSTYITQWNIRPQMLARDLAYYREADATRKQSLAKTANATGDTSKIQNVTIPIVMPQVESALAYHTGVFLTGYPIFGIVVPPDMEKEIAEAGGEPPAQTDEESVQEQMETLIADNQIRFGWAQELMKAIRDGLKYDLGAVEVIWEKKKSWKVGTPKIKQLTTGTVEETLYEGNRIKRLDGYNIILDTRVSPDKNHEQGEFVGYTEILGSVRMKQLMEELDPVCTMNFKAAFESPSTGAETAAGTAGFYTPMFNPDALLPNVQNQPFNWENFFTAAATNNSEIRYQSAYEWTTLYVRLLPSVFGIRTTSPNHVQIWKFIIVNRSVCVFAEQQTNAHGYLPIIVCKPSNDGMGWQSKSFAQNAEPYQYVASALVNSAIESQRRKVYDRVYYDANRVNKKDIDNVSSVARIPVKNSQYNKDIASAIHVSPYRDEGVSDILAFAQNVSGMADFATGQNKVQQGQFQKGNKTKVEFEKTMDNSNNRQQMSALALESSFFSPIKEIIKSNILQYQPPTQLMNMLAGKSVDIDPAKIRQLGFFFKVSDGLLPSSKIANTEIMSSFLQAAMAMPTLQAEYDLGGMVVYNMKLQGADWLDDFKRDQAGMQQYMQSMAQATAASGNAPAGAAGTPAQQAQPSLPQG
jgi:hypothetical protein